MPTPRCRSLTPQANCSGYVPADRPAVPRTTMLPRHLRIRIVRSVAVLCPLLVLGFSPRGGQAADASPAAEWREYQRTVQPFFAKHCFECHADKQSGDVRLDLVTDENGLANNLPAL